MFSSTLQSTQQFSGLFAQQETTVPLSKTPYSRVLDQKDILDKHARQSKAQEDPNTIELNKAVSTGFNLAHKQAALTDQIGYSEENSMIGTPNNPVATEFIPLKKVHKKRRSSKKARSKKPGKTSKKISKKTIRKRRRTNKKKVTTRY